MERPEFVHMKPYIFHDGDESIQDNIMGCSPYSTMGTTKKR
jgi:hypothetical protein